MEIVGSKSYGMYGKSFPEPLITPITVRTLKYQCEVVPLSKSLIYKLEARSVADTGKPSSFFFLCPVFYSSRIFTISRREYVYSFLNA